VVAAISRLRALLLVVTVFSYIDALRWDRALLIATLAHVIIFGAAARLATSRFSHGHQLGLLLPFLSLLGLSAMILFLFSFFASNLFLREPLFTCDPLSLAFGLRLCLLFSLLFCHSLLILLSGAFFYALRRLVIVQVRQIIVLGLHHGVTTCTT
jgi:hypothetical protein